MHLYSILLLWASCANLASADYGDEHFDLVWENTALTIDDLLYLEDHGASTNLRHQQRQLQAVPETTYICQLEWDRFALCGTNGLPTEVFADKRSLVGFIRANRSMRFKKFKALVTGSSRCAQEPPEEEDEEITSDVIEPSPELIQVTDVFPLTQGLVYSRWLAVMNKPENCFKPWDCGIDDIFVHCIGGLGNEMTAVHECGLVVIAAGGVNYMEPTATVEATLTLRMNSCPDEAPSDCEILLSTAGTTDLPDTSVSKLSNVGGAAVVSILRRHGPPASDPDVLEAQINSFNGGCDLPDATCADIQAHVISGGVPPFNIVRSTRGKATDNASP